MVGWISSKSGWLLELLTELTICKTACGHVIPDYIRSPDSDDTDTGNNEIWIEG